MKCKNPNCKNQATLRDHDLKVCQRCYEFAGVLAWINTYGPLVDEYEAVPIDEDGNDVSVNWKEKYEEAKVWAMYVVTELACGRSVVLKPPPWPVDAYRGPALYKAIGENDEDKS